jgi:hypothetical protein
MSILTKRSIQAGLEVDFETPYKGFLNIAAFAYKEWQHDGFASTFPFQPIPNPSGNVEFDPTWAIEINYSQPLGFLPPWLPLKYKALVVMHGPKGCGEPCQPLGPGLIRTTEYLTQQILVFDVGQAFWNLPQRWAIFGGLSLVEEQVRHRSESTERSIHRHTREHVVGGLQP